MTSQFARLAMCVLLFSADSVIGAPAPDRSRPNIVVILADDQGYADVGVFGAKGYKTPNLDRMAANGMRLTDFHVAAAVCSASRAALLTGCYPQRVSIMGALGPKSRHGINPDELLIPEMLQPLDYATAIFGKWHLGHLPRFLPTRHGFDTYFGLPYSNDMWPHHPGVAHLPMEKRLARWPHLPLLENEQVINPQVTPADQRNLTTWYTERAVKFIDEHKAQPFFLYVPHSMPHVPLYVSDKFQGKSQQGLYGDVIMEIDWSVGQILAALRRNQLEDKTLVVYTSDNGPWLAYGNHAGSAGPLREGKGTTWEGGQREPCLVQWPGQVPAGAVCDEFATTMDLLPTLAAITGAELPKRKIDGHNILPLLNAEPNADTPYDAFYYYWGYNLDAVRSGPWKMHFPHAYRSLKEKPGRDGKPGPYIQRKTELALYNLDEDVGEQENVATEHPEVVTKLKELAEHARASLGDRLTGRTGSEVRPPGKAN